MCFATLESAAKFAVAVVAGVSPRLHSVRPCPPRLSGLGDIRSIGSGNISGPDEIEIKLYILPREIGRAERPNFRFGR